MNHSTAIQLFCAIHHRWDFMHELLDKLEYRGENEGNNEAMQDYFLLLSVLSFMEGDHDPYHINEIEAGLARYRKGEDADVRTEDH